MTELQRDQLDRVAGGFMRLAGATRGQRIVNAIGTVGSAILAVGTAAWTFDSVHRTPSAPGKGD